jgi:hypothetical protein
MRRHFPPSAERENQGNQKSPASRSDHVGEPRTGQKVRVSSRIVSYSKRFRLPIDPALTLTLTGTFAKLDLSIES